MRLHDIITVFVAVLVISIPFNISHVLAANDTVEKVESEGDPLYEDDADVFSKDIIKDAQDLAKNNKSVKKCLDKANTSKEVLNVLNHDLVKTLEQVASIIHMVCTLANAITTALTTVSNIIGMIDCCRLGPEAEHVCAAMQESYRSVAVFQWLSYLQTYCWAVTGGICRGKQLDNPDIKNNPDDSKKDGESGVNVYGEWMQDAPMFKSIVVAGACLNIVAIMYNVRKYKTILQIHQCCNAEACVKGVSPDVCDKWFHEALCKKFVGGLTNAAVTILFSMVAGWLAENVMNEKVIPAAFPMCVLTIYEAKQLPQTWQAVQGAWDHMQQTFDKPDCEDFTFSGGYEETPSNLNENDYYYDYSNAEEGDDQEKEDGFGDDELYYGGSSDKPGEKWVGPVEGCKDPGQRGTELMGQIGSYAAQFLGDIAVDKVTQEVCEEEWNSSWINDAGTTSGGGGGGSGGNDGGSGSQECEGKDTVGFQCTCSKQSTSGNQKNFTVEYAIENCGDSEVSYLVRLKKSSMFQDIEDGSLESNETLSTSKTQQSITDYNKCLIKVDGEESTDSCSN